METNKNFTDLLRLLADSHEHPDPDGSPLSDITDLGDHAVPLASAAGSLFNHGLARTTVNWHRTGA